MLVVIRSALIFAAFWTVVLAATGARCAPSDPFGSHTMDVVSGSLLEKWLATNTKLGRDHALLRACTDSEVSGCETALQLRDIIEDAKAQNGLALIGHINRAINLAIKPARSDWLTPLEAIDSNGDCKAYAIAKYFALREAGIAADHLRLVIVHPNNGRPENHMVVATLWQDQWFILDNLTLLLLPDTLSEYVPLFVLDDSGMRGYVREQASSAPDRLAQ
jgi:predicted transglutaminase-like cysteine proteinase